MFGIKLTTQVGIILTSKTDHLFSSLWYPSSVDLYSGKKSVLLLTFSINVKEDLLDNNWIFSTGNHLDRAPKPYKSQSARGTNRLNNLQI
jgi:hypothetical protein